jgi:folate-binding protein YgfZ
MSTWNFIDKSRNILWIRGKDAPALLQGIISNDIYKARSDAWLYSLMLSPQGKILADLFIKATNDGFIVDIPTLELENILAKLKLYKLRSDVTIDHMPALKVLVNCVDGQVDPRHAELGFRNIVETAGDNVNEHLYHLSRMKLLVPDFAMDLWANKFYPHELNMNNLGAIDYKKGCYVGQEVTARVEYRGVVRKRIYSGTAAAPTIKGDELIDDKEVAVGIILGSIEGSILALVREGEYNGLHTISRTVITLDA